MQIKIKVFFFFDKDRGIYPLTCMHASPNYVTTENTCSVPVTCFPRAFPRRHRPPKCGLVDTIPAVIFIASFIFRSAGKRLVLLAR